MNGFKQKPSWDFNNKSINYFDFDVLKSGLQKSIRRCLVRDALWYAVELDSYTIYGKEGEKYRTNMINRIKVIMLEDCFNPNLILTIGKWIRDWETCRKEKKSQKILMNIVFHLASVPKCRLLEEINFYHRMDYIKNKYGDEYIDLFVNVYDWDEQVSNITRFLKEDEFKNKILTMKVSRFFYLLNRKENSCLFWLHLILEEITTVKRYKRKGVEWLVWTILFSLSNSKESFFNKFTKSQLNRKKLLNLLFNFRKGKLRENHLFLQYAVQLFLKEDYICWDNKFDSASISDEKVDELYSYNSNKNKIDIIDCVYDRHTFAGRRMGRGFKHFCKVSSVVYNKDPMFYNKRLRKLFIRLNKNRDIENSLI